MKRRSKATQAVLDLPKDDLEQQFDDQRAGKPLQHVGRSITTSGDLRGQFTNAQKMLEFLQAGKAIFTIVSRKTGTRFTFKCSRPDIEENNTYTLAHRTAYLSNRPRPIWVSVLTGSDNNGDYQFAGTIFPYPGQWTYKHSRKARLTEDAPSVKAIQWVIKHLNVSPETLLTQAEIWHEGRCGRCGRRLTVPESIETGFGPECASRL